jgi:hypothetical protein
VLDTISVPLSNEFVAARIVNGQRLRVALRVLGGASVQLRVASRDNGNVVGPQLIVDPAPGDTSVGNVSLSPTSRTPESDPQLASDFTDYTAVLTSTATSGPDVLALGGMPARRVFLRFQIPPAVLDSATIVRATLLLTQYPAPTFAVHDTFSIYPQVVTSGSAVTDVGRAAQFLGPPPGTAGGLGGTDPLALDSLAVAPADSGTRAIEMVSVLQQWRLRGDTLAPKAIVLRASSAFENVAPQQAYFFSTEGPPELRPQLRISYVPRVPFGHP